MNGDSGRDGRLPNVLLVGAMKAGTTSLAAWLDAHPEVHVAPQKEVGFFSEPYHFWLGRSWYARQFAGAGDALAVVDATPIMQNSLALDHAAELLPDARLVAVLRDPVERAYSHYWHLRAIGDERRSFQRALADERRDPAAARGSPPRDYLWRSSYVDHLRDIDDRFPSASLHVVLFDDLRDDAVSAFREVVRFLGLRDEVPEVVGDVRNPRPDVLRRRWPRRRATAHSTRTAPGGYPPLAPADRAALAEELGDSITALERRLGRDLSAWRSPRVPA